MLQYTWLIVCKTGIGKQAKAYVIKKPGIALMGSVRDQMCTMVSG